MGKTIAMAQFLLVVGYLGAVDTGVNIGGGYFGETITYPGVVLDFEIERNHTSSLSLPFRVELGFYHHPRSHTAVFVDVGAGFRRSFNSGLFLEQSIGIGTMVSFYAGDVYHIDDDGNVALISSYGNWDFMPSLSLGAGWHFAGPADLESFVYIRPKLFWQLPYNNLSAPHLALSTGYNIKLSGAKK